MPFLLASGNDEIHRVHADEVPLPTFLDHRALHPIRNVKMPAPACERQRRNPTFSRG